MRRMSICMSSVKTETLHGIGARGARKAVVHRRKLRLAPQRGGGESKPAVSPAAPEPPAPSGSDGTQPVKLLLCSGGRLESQANAQVRTTIMNGWADLLGPENVVSANIAGVSTTIAGFRPSIVLGIGSYLPESTYFGELARAARQVGAVTAFWATEDPYEQDASYRILHDFDAIFSCDRWGTNFYAHPRVRHLPLAGCPHLHYHPYDPAAPRPVDVMVCGVAFSSRKELVSALLPDLAGLRLQFVGPGWGAFGPGFSDRRIEKAELIRLYGASKIVLNLGRSLHFENRRYMIAPSSPGPRTFETALAGAVQLFHEDTFEMRRYFTRQEVPGFSTPREFADLLHRFLGDAGMRADVAIAAQRRAVAEHTYAHRAQQLLDTLRAEGLL
jgi:spore maturation protein CgeB